MSTGNAREPRREALIVGASRGLGFGLVEAYLQRAWQVVGTMREGRAGGLTAARERWGDRLEHAILDINDPEQIAALRGKLKRRTFDLLIVNAGVGDALDETIVDVSTERFEHIMLTNALSPMRVVESLGSLVTANGMIVVMSSGQGSVSNNTRGGHEVYRASKAALNTLMRSYAARSKSDSRSLLLMAPGWVRTDLGGPDAPSSVEEAIPVLVDTIESQRGITGLQYLDRFGQPVPW